MLFCAKCGAQIREGANFCSECGYNEFSEDPQAYKTPTLLDADVVSAPTLFCSKCGEEIETGEKFCGKCGCSEFSEDSQAYKTNATSTAAALSGNAVFSTENYGKNDFIDPDEHVLKTLGNGYGVNLLYGNAKKIHAILTDKRIYLSGALYSGNGDVLTKVNMEQIIDLEDITGTGFIYSKLSKWMIVLGILTLPTIVIGIILLAKAFLDRKTFFFIQYAGGCINFDANLIGISDVSDFHTQIRRAKNRLKKIEGGARE